MAHTPDPETPDPETHDPRISVSAISTYKLSLPDDLAFWARHGIDHVGVSVAKLDAYGRDQGGWDAGLDLVRAANLRVGNLIGLGPFELAQPAQWDAQRERLLQAVAAARMLDAACLVFTTGPSTPLSWEEAADALELAMAPVLAEARAVGVRFAIEHTNSLRVDVGFVHTLRDVVDLARRLDTGVCMEVNACWAERGLFDTIRAGIDRIALVQLSDFRVGTLRTPDRLVPGDGDIPIARIVNALLTAGYDGAFDLELIGPRIDEEGYDAAVPRAVRAVDEILRVSSGRS